MRQRNHNGFHILVFSIAVIKKDNSCWQFIGAGAMVTDKLTYESGQWSLCIAMLADDTLICCESREQVEVKSRETQVCREQKGNEGQLHWDGIPDVCTEEAKWKGEATGSREL